MPHLALELLLWTLLAFLVGCVLGYIARAVFGRETQARSAIAASLDSPLAEAWRETAPATIPTDLAPLRAEPLAETLALKPERPTGIAQPRGGKPDNLQRISGIGPKNERTLHSLGFFHFDQIAGWTEEEVTWVDNHLKFNGRIVREEWILQASLLAEGREDEFQRLYGIRRHKSRPGEGVA